MTKGWQSNESTPSDDESDESLLPQLARGGEAAFLTLYRRRQASIYRYAFHLSQDAEVAAEAVQETFMALLAAAGKLQSERGPVLAWLFAVARNQVLRQLAARQRHLSFDVDDGPEPAAASGNVLDDLEQAQLLERLREAIATLPVAYREVLVLCDMEGLAYESAAAALGCPVGTVRSRLHRARSLLAEKVRPAVRCTP